MASERHEKWTPVSPGTVVPAGQPFKIRTETMFDEGYVTEWTVRDIGTVLLDPMWKPPLVLPTEPTWGIVVYDTPSTPTMLDRWHTVGPDLYGLGGQAWLQERILDFIPLTDEQVARIEAAR